MKRLLKLRPRVRNVLVKKSKRLIAQETRLHCEPREILLKFCETDIVLKGFHGATHSQKWKMYVLA